MSSFTSRCTKPQRCPASTASSSCAACKRVASSEKRPSLMSRPITHRPSLWKIFRILERPFEAVRADDGDECISTGRERPGSSLRGPGVIFELFSEVVFLGKIFQSDPAQLFLEDAPNDRLERPLGSDKKTGTHEQSAGANPHQTTAPLTAEDWPLGGQSGQSSTDKGASD